MDLRDTHFKHISSCDGLKRLKSKVRSFGGSGRGRWKIIKASQSSLSLLCLQNPVCDAKNVLCAKNVFSYARYFIC